jgi:hypothetical protein
MNGLLYSQIGYDLYDPKRAIIRDDEKIFKDVNFIVCEHATLKIVLRKKADYWGEKWGSHWWVLDFSEVDAKGKYIIKAYDGENLIYQSGIIETDDYLLWNKTIPDVVFTQFKARKESARNQNGWRDCGTEWREVSSICGGIIGLTDMIELASPNFSNEQTDFVMEQLITGCDYLALCQDRAAGLGYPKGCVTHEFPGYMNVIPGDSLAAAVALSKTARLVYEHDPVKSIEYLDRAEAAYLYMRDECKPYGPEGFSHGNHGAPPDFVPPEEFMTRDLMNLLWASYELFLAGKRQYKEDIFENAKKVTARQIPKEKSEDGLYGHFYTFGEKYKISEKSNAHYYIGHDTGAIYPHYILPLIAVCGHFSWHKDAPEWKKCVSDFAYGYLLPACEANPFKLLPVGYFEGHGLLWFCGPWHGINVTYGYAASLALNLEGFTGDKRFRDVAVAQMQWVAGLNSGITRKSFDGCVMWAEDIPEDAAVPMSQIEGIGTRSVKIWSRIPGSIANGFCANIQFTFSTENSVANDKPMYYCDEDWIPHTGGWVSALANLFNRKRFRKPSV